MGPFSYLPKPAFGSLYREMRPLYTYPKGGQYLGQWKKGTNEKDGKGVMLNKYSELYEGYWKDGK